MIGIHKTNNTVKTDSQIINMKDLDLCTALYSKEQNMFHVECLLETIEYGLNTVSCKWSDRHTDYVPFFVGSHDECMKACDEMKELWNRISEYPSDEEDLKSSFTYDELISKLENLRLYD